LPDSGNGHRIFLNFVSQWVMCSAQRGEFLPRSGGAEIREVHDIFQGHTMNWLLPGDGSDLQGTFQLDGQKCEWILMPAAQWPGYR
jgi:hypothetical protein